MMDQRWIPQLLIECANAALPIEVEQLRLNPEKSGAGLDSNSSRSYGGGQLEMKSLGITEPDTNLADVEIRGIVYIYSKPNERVLQIPGLDEDQLADNL